MRKYTNCIFLREVFWDEPENKFYFLRFWNEPETSYILHDFVIDPKIEERGHVLARGLVAFAETSSAAREHASILIAKAEM